MGLLSVGFIIIAVIDFVLLVWAFRLYRQYPSTALWLASVPLGLMWFDNLLIGFGSTIGEGDLLKGLNSIRFVAHYVLLPFAIIAIGSLAKQAGFKWAQPKWVLGLFCALATYFMISDLLLFSQATFYPSCFADTLRYTTHIADYTACSPDAVVGTGKPIPPIPAITYSMMLILFGAYTWWKTGYKFLFIGAFLATGFFAVPYPLTGGIVGNFGEPVISAVLLLACVHFTKTYGSKFYPAPAV